MIAASHLIGREICRKAEAGAESGPAGIWLPSPRTGDPSALVQDVDGASDHEERDHE